MTLNDRATAPIIQTLLRHIRYQNTSENPSATPRTIRVTVSDGDGGISLPTSKTINVQPINDAPVVLNFELPSPISYTENAPAILIDIDVTVSDVDSSNYEGAKLTAQLIRGAQGTDRLEIRIQGTGTGQVSTDGTNVLYGGTIIGSFAGGTGSSPLVVTFNSTATSVMVQTVLRNLTFRNTSENPASNDRTVRVTLTDGDGGTSLPRSKTIKVISVNDAPVIGAFDGETNYRVGAAATSIDTNATISDVDSLNLENGTMTIGISENAQETDEIVIRNQGTSAGQIGINGTDITYGGIVIGSFTGGNGSTPLIVTFNATATPLIAQALLRNITFRSTSVTPSMLSRTVRVSLTDGDGGTSVAATKQIHFVT
ncbi:MAG: hypothetical protein FJ267_14535 [Planctomycetes bacterium]|nr:hypothetical protein [Planctomycetota bacterium]